MSDVVGLTLRETAVDCVVVRRRFGTERVLASFTLEADEGVGATLRARLRDFGVSGRAAAHIGLSRRTAVAKVMELPAVAGADVRRMVGFELERHLPFPPAEALFDFQVLASPPGRPVRVLLVAVDRRLFERIRGFVREAGCVPRLVDLSIHALATLAAGGRSGGGSRASGRGASVVVYTGSNDAELAVLKSGLPVLSRHFALPAPEEGRAPAIADQLTRSLEILRPEDRSPVVDVVALGQSAEELSGATSLPVRVHWDPPGGLDVSQVDPVYLPALAMAWRQPLRGALRTNLVPDEFRPRPFPWAVAATAGLAAATLLLALAIPVVGLVRDQWRLQDLDRQVASLATDVRRVEQLAKAVEQARREIDTLKSFDTQGVRALPMLRELTELLPADVWLTNVSADRKGVELAGFAASAAQLIPLLEGSPTFERVEFTSPVTKGRDREQFRLKASWEGASAPPDARTPPARGPLARPAPGPGGAGAAADR
jgi:general secretion pathway protein L